MFREDESAEIKVTSTIQTLLSYLLIARHRSHSRDELLGLFWADYDQSRARACLRTALCRLRKVLEPEGTSRGAFLLAKSTGEIELNQDGNYWLDVATFEEASDSALAQSPHALDANTVQRLEDALQLYTGELLEGLYDDWVLRERARLQSLYLSVLAHLMFCYKQRGAYQEGLECGRRILQCDPLREQIHREMMRLYLESGQRTLAVRQFETCREILAVELGIPPMEETQSLYRQIASRVAPPQAAPSEFTASTRLQQALGEIRQAARDLEQVRARLRRAMQLVERVEGAEPKGYARLF